MNFKVGDKVVVIAGKDKGKEGKIIKTLKNDNKVIALKKSFGYTNGEIISEYSNKNLIGMFLFYVFGVLMIILQNYIALKKDMLVLYIASSPDFVLIVLSALLAVLTIITAVLYFKLKGINIDEAMKDNW